MSWYTIIITKDNYIFIVTKTDKKISGTTKYCPETFKHNII